MWEDPHYGLRKHKLMTKALAAKIPAIYETEDTPRDEKKAYVKLFSPWGRTEWYIVEYDPSTGECFGLIADLETELGYFSLPYLSELKVRVKPLAFIPATKVIAIERDKFWEPMTLAQIQEEQDRWKAA